MKKALLLSLIVAVSLFAMFAAPTTAVSITASDAGDNAVTSDVTVAPNAICVDVNCECRYDPNTGEYFGDCEDYT